MAKPADKTERLIAENRKARFDYFIEERFEAGLVLQGWEVKSMRAGRAQLAEAYVFVRNEEAFLTGAHITPHAPQCIALVPSSASQPCASLSSQSSTPASHASPLVSWPLGSRTPTALHGARSRGCAFTR